MELGLERLCHITELPRDTSSRTIPGVSLQNAAAAVRLLRAGAPIPTPGQAFATFFYVRPNSRVYGIALRWSLAAVAERDKVDRNELAYLDGLLIRLRMLIPVMTPNCPETK